MIQACNGLNHAHNKNLLHRDIKPGNLMVNEDMKLTIMDFGIVKRLDKDVETKGLKTAHGKIFGTPEYMPPEPPYQPTQQEIYQHLMQQRQQQAYMRHQAMLAPYQNMFASRAR